MQKVCYLFDRTKLIDIDHKALLQFKELYFKLLKDNPFPAPPKSGSVYDTINYLKRKEQSQVQKIGPYKNCSLFEAANRIASDLVIINGILQLIEANQELKKALFSLRLGTTHQKGKGDFTIKVNGEELEGEAFNVAPSFLKQKLRATISKWKGENRLQYILINEEAFEFIKNSKVDQRVFEVKNWYI